MSRRLEDLSTQFRPLAEQLLAALEAAGVRVRVVDTLRTEAEHRANLRAGTSSALRSLHLPRRLRAPLAPDDPNADKADAMDVCLVDLYTPSKLTWNTADPRWAEIGHHAEDLGLEWGGRWRKPYDPGHVQLPRALWSGGTT